MGKINWILIVLVLVGLTFSGFSLKYALNQKAKKERLRDNQKIVLSEMESIKTENGEFMLQVGILKHTNNELKEYYPDIVQELKDMKVKINKISSISNTATNTITNINTVLRDTIIVLEGKDTIQVKKMQYIDPWLTFSGIIINDSVQAIIESRDSLIQVVYDNRSWARRNILFWTRPRLKQRIKSSNPNASITFSETILLTNKKGK